MITLTKNQVKGLITILKSPDSTTRPALQTIRIKNDGFIYITDGYCAIRIKTDCEPEVEGHDEIIIPLANLERWYKLASSKDSLNEITICDLKDDYDDTQYPDINYLFEMHLKNETELKNIKFDSKRLSTIMQVLGSDDVNMSFYSNDYYTIRITKDEFDAILMPLK